jgi:hypothetical protein
MLFQLIHLLHECDDGVCSHRQVRADEVIYTGEVSAATCQLHIES